MTRRILVITVPFRSTAAGAYKRNWRVTPHLAAELRNHGIEPCFYIPPLGVADALRLSQKPTGDTIIMLAADLAGLARAGVPLCRPRRSLEAGIALYRIVERLRASGRLWSPLAEEALAQAARLLDPPPRGWAMAYAQNENYYAIASLGASGAEHYGLLLQFPPRRPRLSPRNVMGIAGWSLYTGRLVHRLTLLQAVSPTVLLEASELAAIATARGARIRVLIPGNAVEAVSGEARVPEEPVAVYTGRVSPAKGALHLPLIWSLVKTRVPRARLLVAGPLDLPAPRARALLEAFRRTGITYLGALGDGELARLYARARLLLYPSLADTYALVALNALANKTLVAAYAIPVFRLLYKGLPPVLLAEPGDWRSLAVLAAKALTMPREEAERLLAHPRVEAFIRLHSSWRRVAREEARGIVGALEGWV